VLISANYHPDKETAEATGTLCEIQFE